jgi:hypothetical protein
MLIHHNCAWYLLYTSKPFWLCVELCPYSCCYTLWHTTHHIFWDLIKFIKQKNHSIWKKLYCCEITSFYKSSALTISSIANLLGKFPPFTPSPHLTSKSLDVHNQQQMWVTLVILLSSNCHHVHYPPFYLKPNKTQKNHQTLRPKT